MMSAPIHVIIPENALRSAVIEAITLAALGEVANESSIAQAFQTPESEMIVIDEAAAADQTFLASFQEIAERGQKKRVFLLGEPDPSLKDNPAVESFSKPIRLGHLLSRLSFHLNTRSKVKTGSVVFGPYRFELQKRELVRQEDGLVIRLTEKEAALLDCLMQEKNAVSREEILASVWGHDERIDTHTLETHIYQLRRKLDPNRKGLNLLVNEQGAYRLNRDDRDDPH